MPNTNALRTMTIGADSSPADVTLDYAHGAITIEYRDHSASVIAYPSIAEITYLITELQQMRAAIREEGEGLEEFLVRTRKEGR